MPRGDEPEPEGPADWIGRAYDRYGAELYRYALMLVMDAEAAADVVQQVFLALVRRPPALDNDAHYLRRAVRNEAFTLLRRRKRAPEGADGHLLEALAAMDDRVEERVALAQALAALPADQREVVHLKAFEGLTFDEIARLLDESINTVSSRYRYALEKMRARLGERSR
jgi:RNA polymerase sigma-70 factor (ECF subfamily)